MQSRQGQGCREDLSETPTVSWVSAPAQYTFDFERATAVAQICLLLHPGPHLEKCSQEGEGRDYSLTHVRGQLMCCVLCGAPLLTTVTKIPEGVQLSPLKTVEAGAHDICGQSEKDGLVHIEEGKAEVGSCWCLQLTGVRVESRQSGAPQSSVSFWTPHYKKCIDRLEKVQ